LANSRISSRHLVDGCYRLVLPPGKVNEVTCLYTRLFPRGNVFSEENLAEGKVSSQTIRINQQQKNLYWFYFIRLAVNSFPFPRMCEKTVSTKIYSCGDSEEETVKFDTCGDQGKARPSSQNQHAGIQKGWSQMRKVWLPQSLRPWSVSTPSLKWHLMPTTTDRDWSSKGTSGIERLRDIAADAMESKAATARQRAFIGNGMRYASH
jgi:hypothetical protein